MKNIYQHCRMIAVLAFSLCITGTIFAQRGGYVAGDFHQHTTYTDGSYSFFYMMAKNNQFKLDWWANSEHGGGFNRVGDVSGLDLIPTTFYWDQMTPNPIIGTTVISGGHQNMWRWQSLRDYSFRNMLVARELYPEKVIIQSYEMNVPGHEHASMGLLGEQFSANPNVNALAEFEYKFDNSDADVVGGASQGWVKSTLSGHAKTLEAIAWLEANYPTCSYIIPAHPERKKLYNIASFRDMNNAGPDICFGFESMPGHQRSSNRGEYSTTSDGGGTYGGCGIYAAQVGGLWDAMLSEGRKYWLFSSSDFHALENDFYPGEYQKTYTYVNDKTSAQSIIDGLRSGNSWIVEGDLIDELDFTLKGMKEATMGESLDFNKQIKIEVTVHDPRSANNFGLNPTLDHIDIIMGKITGLVDPSDSNYNTPSAPATKVIARFDRRGHVTSPDGITSSRWINLGNGDIKIELTLKNVREACYFRLRGTNQGLNVEGETDANGNPLLDVPGTNTMDKAINDLWFYSNPIFAYPRNNNPKSVEADLSETSSVEETEKAVSIYPNPANDVLNVLNVSENATYQINNMSGRNVLSGSVENGKIDISNLQTGLYIVRVKDGTSNTIKKIVVE